MKADAPQRTHKIELGNNYDQADLTRFFKKLYPIKNQTSKGDKTADAKGPWSKPCSILGCKRRASDEPRYEGRCYNCQVKRIVGNLDDSTNDKEDLE